MREDSFIENQGTSAMLDNSAMSGDGGSFFGNNMVASSNEKRISENSATSGLNLDYFDPPLLEYI